METEKKLENKNPEVANKLKLEAAVNELSGFLMQIKSINNVLNMLYSFLSGESKEIAEPSSAIVVCVAQLDYIYQQSNKLLDTILDCNNIE